MLLAPEIAGTVSEIAFESGATVNKGDLLARIKVTVPQKLTKAEKEALEGFDKVLRERPRDKAFRQ